jgi:hypothetical protein
LADIDYRVEALHSFNNNADRSGAANCCARAAWDEGHDESRCIGDDADEVECCGPEVSLLSVVIERHSSDAQRNGVPHRFDDISRWVYEFSRVVDRVGVAVQGL